MTSDCARDARAAGGRWALVPLLIAILSASLAVSMLTTALPSMASDLGTSAAARSWLVDVYPLALAVSIVVAARVGDRFGRVPTLVAGLSAFALLDIAALAADSTAQVVAIRALSGVAGALIIASVVGTIGHLYRGRALAVANGAWVAVFGAANAVGPALGGMVTQSLGWRWVLGACAPIALAAAVSAPRAIPYSAPAQNVSFDPPSIAASVVGIGGIVYGIQRTASEPFTGVSMLLLGVAALFVFMRRQLRSASPFLAIDLFRIRRFRVAFGRIVVSGGAASACAYLTSIHLQHDMGWSPVQAGMALVPQAAATAAGGLSAPFLNRLVGDVAVRTALAIQGVGLGALALQRVGITLPIAAVGLGLGIVGTLAATHLFETAPREDSGQVGALQEIAFAVGSGLGIALFDAIAVAFGPHGFRVALVAAAVPAAFLATIAARPRAQ
ncbi:MFS transporter [Tsukamurella sp. 8F]|uniref:MFS transporter n=1 Tax=unclassified Tsukamurella TaxID=2633480 RepID=UPI0023B8D2A4|nr:MULTISPECIES: MFS transporter [unclassified Tsukamurella]MDF0528478.1 MFS transporter [Tsukamurella sp. 8J]MDF0586304.1 MFS transporter [Tsukamurella sp. 8F]